MVFTDYAVVVVVVVGEGEWNSSRRLRCGSRGRRRARPSPTQRYQHRHIGSEIESHVAVEGYIPRLWRVSEELYALSWRSCRSSFSLQYTSQGERCLTLNKLISSHTPVADNGTVIGVLIKIKAPVVASRGCYVSTSPRSLQALALVKWAPPRAVVTLETILHFLTDEMHSGHTPIRSSQDSWILLPLPESAGRGAAHQAAAEPRLAAPLKGTTPPGLHVDTGGDVRSTDSNTNHTSPPVSSPAITEICKGVSVWYFSHSMRGNTH